MRWTWSVRPKEAASLLAAVINWIDGGRGDGVIADPEARRGDRPGCRKHATLAPVPESSRSPFPGAEGHHSKGRQQPER
jgi:hypothetical protein